jgi:hypothetical protein
MGIRTPIPGFVIMSSSLQGEGIVIVDAGGGTIDVSTYKRVSQEKRVFEEIAMPECQLLNLNSVTQRWTFCRLLPRIRFCDLQSERFYERFVFPTFYPHFWR